MSTKTIPESPEEPPSSMVWVSDEKEVWILLQQQNLHESDNTCTVIGKDGRVFSVPQSAVHPLDSTHLLNLADLCEMSNLHEAPLLDVLRRRVSEDNIYTNTGSVLISINPYKHIDGLYEKPLRYYVPEDQESVAAMAPHVYKTANRAYCALKAIDCMNQSIVVSGESGAGKTEGKRRKAHAIKNHR